VPADQRSEPIEAEVAHSVEQLDRMLEQRPDAAVAEQAERAEQAE